MHELNDQIKKFVVERLKNSVIKFSKKSTTNSFVIFSPYNIVIPVQCTPCL